MWLLTILVFSGIVSAETLLAQINLGDVLRRAPGTPNLPGRTANRERPQAPAVATAEQCKALVDWMSTLTREYPKVNFGTTVVDAVFPKAVNLFRDEYSQSLLGKPFTQASEAELKSYDQTVFRSCGPKQLSQPDLTTLQSLRFVLERPFIARAGQFSYQEAIAGVNERVALIQWRDQALQDLAALPATPEGFDKLEGFRTKGTKDLAKVWPSEQQKFLDALDERRKTQALAVVEQTLQSAAAVKPGFQGAREISSMRAGAGRYLASLDAEGKAKLNAGLDAAISAALRDALQQERAKLNGLPRGIDGALAYVAWRKEFDLQLTGVQNSSTDLASLRGESMAKRRELLAQGLPEFKTLAAQYPKPGPKGKADELIAKLFPNPEDGSMGERQQYQSLLTARISSIQAADQAAEAARQAAEDKKAQAAGAAAAAKSAPAKPPVVQSGKPPHQCDVLAAHPDDAKRVSDGVEDEKIASAAAIQQCSLAVRQSPSTARFQFQLGRAYWAAKQYDKAVPAFLKAQEAKYAPSYFYLGEAYRRGLIKGEKADPEFAKELYQMSAAEGFAPAIVAMGGTAEPAGPGPVVAKAGFDPKDFVHADWMKALLDGDPAKLNQNRLRALVYATGMQAFLALNPNEYDATCLKRVDQSLSAALDSQLNGNPQAAANLTRLPTNMADLMRMAKAMQAPIDQVADAETLQQDGVDDMSALSQNYGGCMGPQVGRMYTTLKRFVREKPEEKKPEEKKPETSTTRLRAPEEKDMRAGPAVADQAKKDLYVLAGRGQTLMECGYPESKQVFLYWNKSIPEFSEALRGAFPGVAPVVLAFCPRTAQVASYIYKNFTEKGASVAQGEKVLVYDPAQLPARRTSYRTAQRAAGPMNPNEARVAADKQPLIECHYPGMNFAVYLWARSLPLVGGQINFAFLDDEKTIRGIMPGAVDACPAKYYDADALQKY
jgi:hypothetical protein